MKHAGHAAARFADQGSDRVSGLGEVQQAVDGSALTHLVIEPCQCDVVPVSEAAVGINPVARHQEQRNSLHAGFTSGNLGQHHMDDIFGELVVAARNPHFAARDPVRPIS